MAKAELEHAQTQYDALVDAAKEAARAGRRERAVALAKEAWTHLDQMMKYEQKYEGRTFKSVPCIDIVLRHAPLMLDFESLSELEHLLRSRKSIDRTASDDLAARTQEARELLANAHRLWSLLESRDIVRQHELRSLLGGSADLWRRIVDAWVSMGIAEQRTIDGDTLVSLPPDLSAPAIGRCQACGDSRQGSRGDLWALRTCDACGQTADTVVLTPQAVQPEGRT